MLDIVYIIFFYVIFLSGFYYHEKVNAFFSNLKQHISKLFISSIRLTETQIRFENLLISTNSFFNQLSLTGKKKFLFRLSRFLKNKKFGERNGVEFTEELKFFVSVTVIQLTFKYSKYKFSSINKILLFPDLQDLRSAKAYIKGKDTNKGTIKLSYKNLVNPSIIGFVNIAEIVRAFELDYHLGRNFNILFRDYFDQWINKQKLEILFNKVGGINTFRRYNNTVILEFFSKCTELFFNEPYNFQDEHPTIFFHLCVIYNMDTANRNLDFAFNKDIIPKVNLDEADVDSVINKLKSFKNRNWHWSLTLSVIGLFVCTLVINAFISITLINIYILFSLILFSAILGYIVQYNYFKKNVCLGGLLYFIYNLLGIGVLSASMLLLLNFLIHFSNPYIENYKIKMYSLNNQHVGQYGIIYYSGTFKIESRVGEFDIFFDGLTKKQLIETESLDLVLQNGIFGFPVIIDNTLNHTSGKTTPDMQIRSR